MQVMIRSFPKEEPARPKLTNTKTTLYELIAAISEEVQPGEDQLVVETVLDLLNTGQVKYLSGS